MKIAVATLQSTAPYSQGRYYDKDDVPKLDRELPKDYERRTWRNRCHVDGDGQLFIPPIAFKKALESAARYLSLQIPGQGKKTYTKKFESGIMILESLALGIDVDDVASEWLHVPSDGRPGGGKRVPKCFPLIREWTGDVTIHVLDEIITKDVLKEHLTEAGQFIGVGRFRPEKRGFYGRFELVKLTM